MILYILSIEPTFIKHMEGTYYNTSMFCPIPLGLLGVKAIEGESWHTSAAD